MTLRLYFYVTLLIQKYKENDTYAEQSRTYSRTILTSDYSIHGRNIASKISPVNNIAVGGVVTRARLMQSRA